jgi:hypothetical protein
MDNIVIGPFITRRTNSRSVDSHVENTGCILEFSTIAEGYEMEIFRCSPYSFQQNDFAAYAVREIDMPFDIDCFNFQVKELCGGPYIALTAFLAGMYDLSNGLTPIKRFFSDFAETLPFESCCCRHRCVDASRYSLQSELAEAGYRVNAVVTYGRRVDVEFGWQVSSRTRLKKELTLSVGGAEFRPRPDRTLGSGKWFPHRRSFVESRLRAKLYSFGSGDPSELLTDAARSNILAEFNWTPLALMTQKEARQARIRFVRENAQIADDTRRLAQALKEAKLYSETTSLSQIRKFLPSLLTKAKTAS